jgi:uncharacterized RDD family membrane protein YckC
MGRRIGAAIIDMILLIVLLYLVGIPFGATKGATVNLQGGPALLYFVLCFAYYILLEWLLAATLGKLLFGVRVVGKGGSKLTLLQSAIRNILRVVDGFPYFLPYLVGFIVAQSSGPRKQRIGDMAAATVVVDPSSVTASVNTV